MRNAWKRTEKDSSIGVPRAFVRPLFAVWGMGDGEIIPRGARAHATVVYRVAGIVAVGRAGRGRCWPNRQCTALHVLRGRRAHPYRYRTVEAGLPAGGVTPTYFHNIINRALL